jgi:hypothetical protein
VPVENVIHDLKERLGAGTDRELAQALGVDPSSVAAWRRRGQVPERHIIKSRIAEGRFNPTAENAIDELSVHTLAFYLDVISNEMNIRPIRGASESLNMLQAARIYFAVDAKVRDEARKKRAKSLEQQVAVVEDFRSRFAGINKLNELAEFVGL